MVRLFFRSEKFRRLEHIPGRWGKPFVGVTLEAVRDLRTFMERWHRTYGGVTRSYGLGVPIVTLLSVEGADALLFDQKDIFSSHKGYLTSSPA